MGSIYDNEEFFGEYAKMSRSMYGLEAAGEWKQMQRLFPDLKDRKMLDLGCGYGWHCHYAAQQGAAEILGIDASEKMIRTAMEKHPDPQTVYQVCSLEEYAYPENTWDAVLSNLVLHYIQDLEPVYRNVYRTLKEGGTFLFNIEHPTFTAGVRQEWILDAAGNPLYWPVDDYYDPGKRETIFLGEKVMKQHHTLSQILNPLIACGFTIEAVEEVIPPSEMMDLPGMKDEMRRPMMLMVKAVKPKQTMPVQEAMQKRRSVRRFTDEEVSAEDVQILLHAAMSGPSACNKRPWEFYVVTEAEVLQQLRKASPYTNIPGTLAIVVCGNLQKALPEPHASYWIQDCSAASENILLQASELALGTVWCGVHPQEKAAQNVRNALHLPEDQIPLNILWIGHPAETPEARDWYEPDCVHEIR